MGSVNGLVHGVGEFVASGEPFVEFGVAQRGEHGALRQALLASSERERDANGPLPRLRFGKLQEG